MSAAARKIRDQLRAQPNRKTFRKTRATLLEIAVELECLRKTVADMQAQMTHPAHTPPATLCLTDSGTQRQGAIREWRSSAFFEGCAG